jgi:hypothetical protein
MAHLSLDLLELRRLCYRRDCEIQLHTLLNVFVSGELMEGMNPSVVPRWHCIRHALTPKGLYPSINEIQCYDVLGLVKNASTKNAAPSQKRNILTTKRVHKTTIVLFLKCHIAHER